MENQIVKANGNGIIDMPNYQAFDDEIESLPLILPYLRIGQKDEVAGKIIDTAGVTTDKITACIVKITTGRSKWKKPYDPAAKYPLCRSYDGKVPDVNLFISGKADGRPPADTCKACPYSKTGTEDSWTRPECDVQFVIWGIDVENGTPFVLNLNGMSLSSKSQTKGAFSVKQYISNVKIRRQPLYLFKTEISIGKAKGEKGSAYVGLFRILSTFSQEELTGLSAIIRDMAKTGSDVLEKAENAMENQEDSDGMNYPDMDE